MTVLYPNLCYSKVCYKGTALNYSKCIPNSLDWITYFYQNYCSPLDVLYRQSQINSSQQLSFATWCPTCSRQNKQKNSHA